MASVLLASIIRPRISRNAVFWAAIAAFWVLILPSTLPVHIGDRGIFVSVAERLLAGDRLYVDVWDNKDPFFFYLVALQRLGGFLGEALFEAGLIAACSAIFYAIVRPNMARAQALLIAGLAVPLILTGRIYAPGYTALAGVALSFASIMFALRGKYLASGAGLGLLLFTNILFLPMAGLAVLAGGEWRGFWRLVQGALITAAAVLLVLFLRGELHGYLATLQMNFAYSQGSLVTATSFGGKVWAHLARVMHAPAILITAVAALVAAYAILRTHWTPLARAMLAVLAGALLVIALIGMWRQHGQILFVPALLSLALLSQDKLPLQPVATVLAFIGLAWLLGGARNPLEYAELAEHTPVTWHQGAGLSAEAEALIHLSSPSPYARLGTNDFDEGHAYGTHAWKLACPRFHQYAFLSAAALDKVLSCVRTADTVLVSPSFVTADKRDWNAFVQRSEVQLRAEYSCHAWQNVRVCQRHHGSQLRAVHHP